MRKLTTIVTALTLALAVSASATVNQPANYDVRPFTMGGEKINNILKSQSNIWLYPQTISMYADQSEAIFDASSANELARLGINYQFGSKNPCGLGIDVNNTNGHGLTPLYVAAKNGHLGVVRWLVLSGGAGRDRVGTGRGTALYIAI